MTNAIKVANLSAQVISHRLFILYIYIYIYIYSYIHCKGLRQIVLVISVTEISCLGRCLWIPNREFNLKVSVLYVVYCLLTKDMSVSINTT